MAGERSVHGLGHAEAEHLDQLRELALDLRWSWSHEADQLWKRLDPDLWEATHNPWVVLQTVSRGRLLDALADVDFHRSVEELVKRRRSAARSGGWFDRRRSKSELGCVAYLSMEFMLSEALPIYSGGLGNVAGDQLKAASDLGVPVVGVGLLYQRGYFRQVVGPDGEQRAFYPYNDPGQLPITPFRDDQGNWVRIRIGLPGRSLWLRAWQVEVGRVSLYLLDSNDPANEPPDRGITEELYGGGAETRLQQEIALGIGGWRLLEALPSRPEVCHLNEGHAALAVLERARSFTRRTARSFEVALTATRPGNLFTSHTPVEAGFDRFSPALVERFLGEYAERELGIPMSDLLALGRADPADPDEPFNMAYLAVRGSGSINGVSRLHGRVSRAIFQPLFPRWPEVEVPVGHVTNGIHTPSWDSVEADALWTDASRKSRWRGAMKGIGNALRAVEDEPLWRMRCDARGAFIEYARERLVRQLQSAGATPDEVDEARGAFDRDALTIGFARRFAEYKRPTLLLHDRERLLRILTDPKRPAQLVVAGKAHPADEVGRALVREWTTFARTPEARGHVVFLTDYDMLLTERMVQGVDVWLNTPRRPWEACGTSGMKVLVNGGLNLSELDGWWAEAYAPEVGWALGDGRAHGEDPEWDAAEAEALYALLEGEVATAFYERGADGVPGAWVSRMRESMARLTPRFSSNRAVRGYTLTHYLPAAREFRARSEADGEPAAALVEWKSAVEAAWPEVRFGRVDVSSENGRHRFDVDVILGALDPEWVRVELYADGIDGGAPDRTELTRGAALRDGSSGFRYSGQVPAERPASDYTARVIPDRPGVAVPLEAAWIRWAR